MLLWTLIVSRFEMSIYFFKWMHLLKNSLTCKWFFWLIFFRNMISCLSTNEVEILSHSWFFSNYYAWSFFLRERLIQSNNLFESWIIFWMLIFKKNVKHSWTMSSLKEIEIIMKIRKSCLKFASLCFDTFKIWIKYWSI